MGRPSLTATSARRPTTRSENEDEETFPRRFPRTGNIFQVKALPDVEPSYRSERETPLLMSTDVPYCTVDEQSSGSSASQKTSYRAPGPWSSSLSTNGSLNIDVSDSKFHAAAFPFMFPDAGTDAYDTPTKVTSTSTVVTRRESSSKKSTSDESELFDAWVKTTCKWQSEQQISIKQSQQQPRRKARTTKKRARESDGELPLPKRAGIMDNREGGSTQVVWSQLVALSGGRMCFVRRHKEKPRSWKNLLEPVTILGDFRSRTNVSPPFSEKDSMENADEIWQAVLALCEAVVTQLKLPSEHNPIYLSQVMRLLEYCNRLPDPEDVFVVNTLDTTIKDIHDNLDALVGYVETARLHQASLFDAWHNEGADVEELRKRIDTLEKESPLQVDELHELKRQTDAAMNWQTRLDAGFKNLDEAEALVREGETIGFESRGLSQLKSRLNKVYEIRDSIREWRLSGKKESIKFVAGLVREIQRVRCPFEEADEVLSIQQEVESWIDRASIAIRTKLSLQEMDDLVTRGEMLPLDLSEFADKLSTRITLGKSWLLRFEGAVQQPETNSSQSTSLFMFKWMQNIRSALNSSSEDGDTVIPTLHELASEGGRLPVQVDCVQLLQIEIEARSWSAKAKKWESKRPKLEELQEHVSKATNLRERLVILDISERESWQLEGEGEVRKLVDEVETWLKEYDSFSEKTWSLENLRALAEAAEKIAANLGPAASQLNKALNQAEDWYKQNAALIQRCRSGETVDVLDLRAAVKAADNDLSVELEEALHLQNILDQVSEWMNKTSMVAGVKRKGKKCTFSIDDLEKLIKQAEGLPVDTNDEVSVLLKEIDVVLLRRYGSPELYDRKKIVDKNDTMKDQETSDDKDLVDLQTLVDEFNKDTSSMVVATPESTVAPTLEVVCRWCIRSKKYLDSQRDIFDKRFFGAFDRFIAEGRSFCDGSFDGVEKSLASPSPDALESVRSAFSSVVRDQLERLASISKDREDFIKWSKTAEAIISSGDRKPALEKLKEISSMGREFPSECELVERLRSIVDEALKWTKNISELLSSEEKITMAEARSLCDEADKVGFTSPEVKKIQSEIKAARAWANQVKRSKIDQGSLQARTVQSLIEEHESLLIHMPEELTKLKHAVKNYCICRRPYEGFMIGCDDCGDWFHVGCIGVTESKANRVEKYTCVRCSAVQSYKTCAASLASTIKKWTSGKELKRARQVLAQKHQRRVRKETKQIENLESERKELLDKLSKFTDANSSGEFNRSQESNGAFESPIEASVNQGPAVSTMAVVDEAPIIEENSVRPEPDTALLGNVELGKDQIESKLRIIDENLGSCQSRLVQLADDLSAKKSRYREEDQSAQLLKKWSVRVRELFIAPTTAERALASRPSLNSQMLAEIKKVSVAAGELGINCFEEVTSTHDALARLEWTFRVLIILARRPSIEELALLVDQAKDLKAPDDKALRVMRFLKKTREKAETWQVKAAKALTPVPSETRNFDINTLRELLLAADDIPVHLPFESRLATVVEDKGVRHCLCGGPSDGRFMLCCDQCSKWYHGQCLRISKDTIDEEAEWKCPVCVGEEIDKSTFDLKGFHDKFEMDTEMDDQIEDHEDVSSNAPNLDDLWPPCGLLGSEKAKEALGEACCSIPDNTDCAKVESVSIVSQVTGDNVQLPVNDGDAVQDAMLPYVAPIASTTIHNLPTISSTPTDENWLQRVLSVQNTLPLTTAAHMTAVSATFGNIEQMAAALRLQQAVPTLHTTFTGGMVNQPVMSANGSVDGINSIERSLALLAGRDPLENEIARQHEILVNALTDAGRNP